MALTISLMPHQKEAVGKLSTGSILCGGVGTGKSMTALAYYYRVVCRGVVWNDCTLGPLMEPRPLYIITTAKKRDSGEWYGEMKRFGLEKGGENEVPCVIDSWNNVAKYAGVHGAFFIFDEQRVVGKGKWVKAFLKIARRNQWILLTATPGDTWEDYIPVFVANRFYRNRSEFLREHAVFNPYITKFPKIEKWIEVCKLERFRRQITVLMEYDRKTIRHWKTIKDSYDREKYDIIAKKRWDPWKNEPIKDISGVCYLLRRVCNSNADRARNVLWLTMNTSTQRSIVFYNYDYELNLLKDVISETLEELRDKSSTFGGSDDFDIAEWNGHRHDPVPRTLSWIYLVQYNAGAEGWNCVDTDTVIFYSQSYSYKMTEQAAGRIDRLNTPFSDLYYYVLTTDSAIDKAIARALKDKKTFNEKRFFGKDMMMEEIEESKQRCRERGKKTIAYIPVAVLRGGERMYSDNHEIKSLMAAHEEIAAWKDSPFYDICESWIEVRENGIVKEKIAV